MTARLSLALVLLLAAAATAQPPASSAAGKDDAAPLAAAKPAAGGSTDGEPAPTATTKLPARDAAAPTREAAASAEALSSDSPWSPATIRDLKRTVVSIDEARPVALTDDKRGAGQGTGFVVDAERGLVVTNRHISTVSPVRERERGREGEGESTRGETADSRSDRGEAWVVVCVLTCVSPSPPPVSQAIYRLRFFDGSVAPARVLYYDVSQDFAILKFNR
jgi:S1-C subfamily serine protease